MSAEPAPGRRRRLAFLPLAPLCVIALGVTAAVVVAWAGIRELEAQSGARARASAELLCSALAARLSVTEVSVRPAVLERAAQRSGHDVAWFHAGNVPAEGDLAGWVVVPVDGGRLAVRPKPGRSSDLGSLLGSVAALTWVLVAAAALVAFAIARDVRSDVAYVGGRIDAMASEDGEPAGKSIPVRNIDQVGMLTVAFNGLVERFTAAERAYRQDLAGALAYDKDRSAFLAALSHELRTPLNAILGFTDVLLAEVDGPLDADARENLEVVRSSGEHLRELIDDILELSALESGELELEPREVELWPIAEEVAREARINAQDKPLEVALEGEPVRVWGDPRRIRQIFANVVGNAVKFTAEGTVRMSVSAHSDAWACVSVSDTGPGIAPEDQAAIFDEYRQAGDVAARRAGSGLGLAITRRLLTMHGGKIDLERARERLVFRLFLPREAPETEEGRA